MPSTARSWLTLARWLGPWAGETALPASAVRRQLRVAPSGDGEPALRVWVYAPARDAAIGAYLISPGLHYAGPADPRMDRFCRVLAAAGMLVYAPFVPDYLALRVTPQAIADVDRAFGALLADPQLPAGCRPGVFSISFGSLLALRLAASPARADRVGGLVLFGGYANWAATVHYCLTGEVDGVASGARDPLNQPVVVMNLLDHMNDAPADPAPLIRAWRTYVEATWGRPEMKVDRRFAEVARRIAPSLPVELREWFLVGVGVLPGARERCADALARLDDGAAFLDPLPYLSSIRCPVHLMHGADDDVIPLAQSRALASALPARAAAQLYVTGLYGHADRSNASARLRELPAAARELWTIVRMLAALQRAGTTRAR